MAEIEQEIARMTDDGLAALHGRLDDSDLASPADVQAHHLVTTEILRRGGSHGHEGDGWDKAVILIDSVDVESADDIVAPDGMEKAWGEALAGGGTVSVMLTVNGYVLKADPSVSDVHVDSVMGGGGKTSVPALSKESAYAVPESVQAAAKKALQWIDEGRAGDGFTSVGRDRAKQLASGGTVSRSTLVKMRAYLARHVVDKDAEGWGDRSDPTPGMVAWFAWGGDAGRSWVNEVLGRVEKRSIPAVITDLRLNIENRQHAIDEYLYGPMNPEDAGDYWRRLGEVWGVSASEAATTRCGNCAAFNVSPEILSAMGDAIGEGGDDVVAAADLGYCELLDFKCASSRACSAWLVGGPIGAGEERDDEYGGSEEDFIASLDQVALKWLGDIGLLIDNDGDLDSFVEKAGNPEPLRDYWRGGGKGKIAWGAGGDFTSCVAAVSKYMNSEQAKGYCAIRHREVTGMWPGDKRNRMGKTADVLKHGTHDQSSHGKKGSGSSSGGAGKPKVEEGPRGEEASTWTQGMPVPALVPDDAPGTVKGSDGKAMPRTPEASAEAVALRERSAALEPATTAMVTAMAAEHGGEMSGLEYRLKTADSLARKIDADSVKEHGGDRAAAAADVSDSLRYTTVFDNDNYTSGTAATLDALKADGYSIRAKNFWQEGDPYQGMNVKATKDGVTVELQFHTRDSVRIKGTTLHPLYEDYRKSTDDTKRRALWDKMVDTAKTIPKPAGYTALLGIGTLTMQTFETAQQAGLMG